MSRNTRNLAAALAILIATAYPALAQTSTKGCTDQERKHEPLGQKLKESNGVICPPDIDQGMRAPTPDGGKTPVIPPPGSPGGNPNVQPK
jgi:hypothetical protein